MPKGNKSKKKTSLEEILIYKFWKRTKPFLITQADYVRESDMTFLGFALKEYNENQQVKGKIDHYWKKAPKTEKQEKKFCVKMREIGYKIKFVDHEDIDQDTLDNFGFSWEKFKGYEYTLKKNKFANKISNELIKDENHHSHLAGVKIGHFFVGKEAPYDEITRRMTFAYAKVANNDIEKFAKYDFVIYYYEDAWEELQEKYKYTLVDHELCHCGFEGNPYLIEHDIVVEEFIYVKDKYELEAPNYNWSKDTILKVLASREE